MKSPINGSLNEMKKTLFVVSSGGDCEEMGQVSCNIGGTSIF